MHILGLPGRKASTLAQLQALLARVELGQDGASIQTYGFWGSEDVPDPDIAPEARIAAESGADIVLAKSIGSLVTMLAIERHGLAPRLCIFFGTPLRRFQGEGLLPLLAAHMAQMPTLFIQQTSDPNGAYGDLAALAAPRAQCRAFEVPGDDHLYDDVDALAQIIEREAPGMLTPSP
jgi:hypothetical protein